MSSNILNIFKEICKIPHPSYHTEELRDWLVIQLKDLNCEVSVDEAGNIHAYKGEPKICLQGHYDMVCVGRAPDIELIEKDGVLSAKESSLGADNGMAIAMALDMLSKFDNLEILFTNDEEVGLWGVQAFKGPLKAKKILNLDSEEDDRVTIGCASSIEILTSKNISFEDFSEKNIYEVEVHGLRGGHSGVQIHEKIPNAIKVLCRYLKNNDCKIIEINSGERRNSIAAKGKAIVATNGELKDCENIKVTKVENKGYKAIKESAQILAFINSFAQGVRAYSSELDLVDDSINISILKQENDKISIDFYARSMSVEGLQTTKFEIKELADLAGFNLEFHNEGLPWFPEVTDFANIVLAELKKYKPDARLTGIHAGLECGVLLNNLGDEYTACSIGPNIHSPHSIHESCELASVELIAKVVEDILKKYNS